jgi:hypothetical protein
MHLRWWFPELEVGHRAASLPGHEKKFAKLLDIRLVPSLARRILAVQNTPNAFQHLLRSLHDLRKVGGRESRSTHVRSPYGDS